jgi:hypothetical protein
MKSEAALEPEAKGADERGMRDPRGWYSWWPGGQGKGLSSTPAEASEQKLKTV